jgi:hypothetical protein
MALRTCATRKPSSDSPIASLCLARARSCLCVSVCARARVCLCACMCARVCACACVCVHLRACLCAAVFACVHVRGGVLLHAHDAPRVGPCACSCAHARARAHMHARV